MYGHIDNADSDILLFQALGKQGLDLGLYLGFARGDHLVHTVGTHRVPDIGLGQVLKDGYGILAVDICLDGVYNLIFDIEIHVHKVEIIGYHL